VLKILTKAIGVSVCLGLSACASLSVDKPSMAFSSKCIGSSDLTHREPRVSSQWDDATFQVVVIHPEICNARIVHPAFQIDGENLSVSYESKISNVVMKCYCDIQSTFAFTRLPKADYRVRFEPR